VETAAAVTGKSEAVSWGPTAFPGVDTIWLRCLIRVVPREPLVPMG